MVAALRPVPEVVAHKAQLQLHRTLPMIAWSPRRIERLIIEKDLQCIARASGRLGHQNNNCCFLR